MTGEREKGDSGSKMKGMEERKSKAEQKRNRDRGRGYGREDQLDVGKDNKTRENWWRE